MKSFTFIAVRGILILMTIWLLQKPARAQGTGFTYQGVLQDNGAPFSGLAEIQPSLWNAVSDGTKVAKHQPEFLTVPVTNGLFTVQLDFESKPFDGQPVWLQLEVRPAGAGVFTTLSPRQPVTSTPYAVRAAVASSIAGAIPSGNFAGTYSNAVALTSSSNVFNGSFNGSVGGNGLNLTNLSVSSLVGEVSPAVEWAASHLGSDTPAGPIPTLQNVLGLGAGNGFSLALQVNGRIAAWGAQLPGQSNVVAGLVDAVALAAGDLHALAVRANGTVLAWGRNTEGQTNVPPGLTATAVAGGFRHSLALRANGTVTGWGQNTFGQTTIPAGLNGVRAIAAGDNYSMALRSNGTVVAWGLGSSGQTNIPAGLAQVQSIAAGGTHCLALRSNGTVVAWGLGSSGQTNIPAGLNNVTGIAAGLYHSLAIKSDGTVVIWGEGESSVPARLQGVALRAVARGRHNLALRANRQPAVMASLEENNVFVAQNTFTGPVSIHGDAALSNTTVAGSALFVGEQVSFSGGAVNFYSPVLFDTSTEFSGPVSFRTAFPTFGDAEFWGDITLRNQMNIFGSSGQVIMGLTDAGVQVGTLQAGTLQAGTLQAGTSGILNFLSAANPAVFLIHSSAAPGFGRLEFRSDPPASGSEWRPAYIQSSDAGGFTGGLRFVVNGTGAGNRFGELETMRIVNGRVGIMTATPAAELDIRGAVIASVYLGISDRNTKENFVPVNAAEILNKITALPLSRWNFTNDTQRTHLGPMAQDFHAAFGLNGEDEKSIAISDANGVALAAIQGLNQKVETNHRRVEDKIQQLETENAQLKSRLDKLERLLGALPPEASRSRR